MSYQDARRIRRNAAVDAANAAQDATNTAQDSTDVDLAAADVVLEAASVQIAELTVGFAELTDADGAQSFPFAQALPAGAVILAVGLDVTDGFTDGVAGVFTADLGISGGDIDAFLDGAECGLPG